MTIEQAKQAINEVVEALRPIVAKIEARPETTKAHYGDYMTILGMAKGSEARQSMSLCLLKAGANYEGVASALNLLN